MAGSKRVDVSLAMALIGLAAAGIGGCTALAGLDESYHLVGGSGGGSGTGGNPGSSAGGSGTGGDPGGSADSSGTGSEGGGGADGSWTGGDAGGSAECTTCSLPPADTADPADMCEASAEIYDELMECLCVACGIVEGLPCYGACGAGEGRSAECDDCLAGAAAEAEGECASVVAACEFDTGE